MITAPIALQGFALDIFKKRYALHENESFEEACHRVADHMASAEAGENIKYWRDEFYNILSTQCFMPGGRIWYGSGRLKGQLQNCFVLPISDSREGWGEAVKNMIIISGTGGGVGINCSPVRPRGTPIVGTGGVTTGAVSPMEIMNAAGGVIKAGGSRRAALLFCLNLNHGDIVEFLDKKLDQNELKNSNISVVFNENPEEFFKKVKENQDLELFFRGRIVGRVNAKDIWSKLIKNALKSGEPGILNGYLANKMSNIWYIGPLVSTNPCLTSETNVLVADGRGNVPIGILASEGKDVPVFCRNPLGEIVVRYMRHPRITGQKIPVYKVTLDDNSIVRVTENHKFLMSSGEYKETKNLIPGESLYLLTKMEASIKDVFPDTNSKSQNYFWLKRSDKGSLTAEHRLIASFNFNTDIPTGYVVHHKDFNTQNNDPSNLQIISKKDHDKLHSQNMVGDNNPMRRAAKEWSIEKWNAYKQKHSVNNTGEKNHRFLGVTNDQIKDFALVLTKQLGRRFSQKEWMDFARINNLPINFSKWRKDHLGGVYSLSVWAAQESKVLEGYEKLDTRLQISLKKVRDEGYQAEVVDNKIEITKSCEACGKQFQIPYSFRESGVCSSSCANKISWKNTSIRLRRTKGIQEICTLKRERNRQKQLQVFSDLKFSLGREPFQKEWGEACKKQNVIFRLGKKGQAFGSFSALKEEAQTYNHKIISVEFDGHEDVYNGTVDEFHNFFIGGFEGVQDNGKKKWSYLNNLQCGELWLSVGESCVLGSLVLPRFVEGREVNYEELARVIKTSVRFLDNVTSVNHYPLAEIAETCKNLRRIGLGVMGLHDMLLMCGLKYNSDAGLELVDKVMSFIKNTAYQASCELAKEKGAFPLFDTEKFLKSGFIKTLKPSLRSLIRENGIRNCAILTIAPTGTTSLVCDCSSGIEPMFSAALKRKYYVGDKLEEEIVIHPLFKKFIQEGRSVKHFQGAHDLSIKDHFEMQRVCQRHVDNSISKTINLPPGTSESTLSDLYMEYLDSVKGVTVYPENSRENQPLTPIPLEEAIELAKQSSKEEALSLDACKDGKCDL